jgi:hypothetical protein
MPAPIIPFSTRSAAPNGVIARSSEDPPSVMLQRRPQYRLGVCDRLYRLQRDELHFITREWDALLARWDEIPVRKAMHMDRLLNDTYRLLANKFATAKSMLSK